MKIDWNNEKMSELNQIKSVSHIFLAKTRLKTSENSSKRTKQQ